MIAKTQEEIEILREGGRRLARHVRTLCEMVRPGVATRTLEEHSRLLVRADGDELSFLGYRGRKDTESFPSGLCVSINDTIVHSPAGQSNMVIAEGDVVSVDFGIRHRGLYTDHAATVIAGKAKSVDDERLVRGTYEALAAGIAQAIAGNTVGDIGYAIQCVAKKFNLGFPRNLSGHGVGRAVHEDPQIPNFGKPGEGEVLIEGLVVAIEPMMTLGSGELYVDRDGHSYRTRDGSRAAHAEHTVLITQNGPEILTRE